MRSARTMVRILALAACCVVAALAFRPWAEERPIPRAPAPAATPAVPVAAAPTEPPVPAGDPWEAARELGAADADARWRATRTLVASGRRAVQPLLRLLAELDADTVPFEPEAWNGAHECRRAHVLYAVRAIGEPAIAPLVEALAGPDRLSAILLLGALADEGHADVLAPLTECLASEPDDEVVAALFGLDGLGPDAAPALDAIERCYARERVAWAAAYPLVAIGPAAIPVIDRVLRRQRDGGLMHRLADLDGDRARLVPALLDVLAEGAPHEKRDAAWALADLGPDARDAAPALRVLAAYDTRLGWSTVSSGNTCCADALLALGVDDAEAARLIEAALARGEEPTWRMRARAAAMDPMRARAMVRRMANRLGAEEFAAFGAAAVPVLRERLRHGDRPALCVLIRLGADARAAIPDVRALLAHPELRADAITFLARAGERPVTEPLPRDAAPLDRIAAARAYLQATGDRAGTAHALAGLAADDRAAAVLRACGDAARHLLPAMLAIEAAPHARSRIKRPIPERLHTLAALAPLPGDAVAKLHELLGHPDAGVRVGAAVALHRCGVDPHAYLQVLIEGTLPDRYRDMGMTSSIYRDEGVRIAAIETIAQLGARGRPALPLLHAVRPRFKNVRRAADAAIARLE